MSNHQTPWKIFCLTLLVLVLGSCDRCRDGCLNGICIKKVCQCDQWYEGDACERSILLRYVDEYEGTISWNDTSTLTVFNITSSLFDPSKLYMDSVNLELSFESDTRFKIDEQNWRESLVSGEGEMLLDAVSMRFSAMSDTGTIEYRILSYR